MTYYTVEALKDNTAEFMDPNESAELGPEQILLNWFNFHLKKAGHHRTVSNFSTDIAVSITVV